MSRSNPLEALWRLRRVETRIARVHLATALSAEGMASEAARTHQAIQSGEMQAASHPDYVRWVPMARATEERLASTLQVAAAEVVDAKSSVATATISERAVAEEFARRAADLRSQKLIRDQISLDDVSATSSPTIKRRERK